LHFTWWSFRRENEKNKGAVQSKASNSSISNFLNVKTQSEMEKQLSLAAQEATFAYHMAVHNHSFKSIFKSMDCTIAIVKILFNDKFRCSQTKCKAIITNVIAPFAIKQIDEELKEARFLSVLIKPLGQKVSASGREILSCRKRCEGEGVGVS
jgi:hypothetical protein